MLSMFFDVHHERWIDFIVEMGRRGVDVLSSDGVASRIDDGPWSLTYWQLGWSPGLLPHPTKGVVQILIDVLDSMFPRAQQEDPSTDVPSELVTALGQVARGNAYKVATLRLESLIERGWVNCLGTKITEAGAKFLEEHADRVFNRTKPLDYAEDERIKNSP